MSGRDDLLAKCFSLLPGMSLTVTAAALEEALPEGERPPEWTAIGELLALLSEDPDLRVDWESRPGELTVMRIDAQAIARPWLAAAVANAEARPVLARRQR